jgi:hypothetical protein
MLDPAHNANRDGASLKTATQALDKLRDKIMALFRAWGRAKERYADLHSRARTPAAYQLIAHIRDNLGELERRGSKRLRNRRAKSGAKFLDAIERFVGDLLNARAGTTAPALIYHAVGKTSFTHDPVKYDTFHKLLDGLKALELVGHQKGQTRYRKADFGPDAVFSVAMRGRAARFWATGSSRACGALRHRQS